MTVDERSDLDREWSRRVAGIAVATLVDARPLLLSLTPEQIRRCADIVAEEILVRLSLKDRPPA